MLSLVDFSPCIQFLTILVALQMLKFSFCTSFFIVPIFTLLSLYNISRMGWRLLIDESKLCLDTYYYDMVQFCVFVQLILFTDPLTFTENI